MLKYPSYIALLLFLFLLSDMSVCGQEVLRASRIQARANRKNLPALGLPQRASGELDPVVWYKEGNWRGADSLSAPPFWVTERLMQNRLLRFRCLLRWLISARSGR